MTNEVENLDQIIEEGLHALEILDETDNNEKCKLWLNNFDKIKLDFREGEVMSKVKASKVEVSLTEQTLKEIISAVKSAKRQERASAIVESEYSRVFFNVSLEMRPHTQESLGYSLSLNLQKRRSK